MKYAIGGTDKWCPICEGRTIVKAVDLGTLGVDREQHIYLSDYPDIHWFRRGQICQTCGHEWLSAELHESLVDELQTLRNLVSHTRTIMEAYVEAADEAEKKLAAIRKKLSDLDVLVERSLIHLKPRAT